MRAAGTAYALPGVQVMLLALMPALEEPVSELPALVTFTYTSTSGTYAFTGLPASDHYWVCFDTQFINGYTTPAPPGPLRAYQDNCYLNRPGFNPQPDLAGFYPWPPTPGSTPIQVANGQQVTGIDASLVNPAVTNPANAGSISGKVTQSMTGQPLRGATVVVFNPFGKVVGETLTGGQGKYTVTNVLAARFSYTVCVNGSAATGGTGLHGYAKPLLRQRRLERHLDTRRRHTPLGQRWHDNGRNHDRAVRTVNRQKP